MIDSIFTRDELDQAAGFVSYYRTHIDTFAGWSYMISVEAENYRHCADQFLAAYRGATGEAPEHFPIGPCIYIDREGDGYRMIADPAFGVLSSAIEMGPDPFVDTSGNRDLSKLAAKFYTKPWRGEDPERSAPG